MINRSTVVVYGYDEARKRGEKHLTALQEAVACVRKEFPGMPISETEVRRVLAKWRPRGKEHTVLLVSKPDVSSRILTLPDGRRAKVLYSVSVGYLR